MRVKGYPAQVAAGGALSRDAGAAVGVFVLILNIVAGARTVFADGGGYPAQTRPKPTQWKRREPSVSFPAA